MSATEIYKINTHLFDVNYEYWFNVTYKDLHEEWVKLEEIPDKYELIYDYFVDKIRSCSIPEVIKTYREQYFDVCDIIKEWRENVKNMKFLSDSEEETEEEEEFE